VWYINLDRSFYRFVTMHACDGQTDGRADRRPERILIAIPRLHYMQRGKNLFFWFLNPKIVKVHISVLRLEKRKFHRCYRRSIWVWFLCIANSSSCGFVIFCKITHVCVICGEKCERTMGKGNLGLFRERRGVNYRMGEVRPQTVSTREDLWQLQNDKSTKKMKSTNVLLRPKS